MSEDTQITQIEALAKEHLELDSTISPDELGSVICFFAAALASPWLMVADDFTVSLSQKVLIPPRMPSELSSLAAKVALLFWVKHVELINYDKDEDYIAFVGSRNDAHAAYLVLKRLIETAANKKNSGNWLKSICRNINGIVPNESNDDKIAEYIADNFHTDTEFRQALLATRELEKICDDMKDNTLANIEKIIKERYEEQGLKKLSEKAEKLYSLDLLINYSPEEQNPENA